VSVTVSGTRTALVILSTECLNNSNNNGCLMSFALSGATIAPPADSRAVGLASMSPPGTIFAGSGVYVVTLNSGTTTFTAQYRTTTNGTIAQFLASSISVIVF
jgi:hypothetical protein